jgi:hypothetical protein
VVECQLLRLDSFLIRLSGLIFTTQESIRANSDDSTKLASHAEGSGSNLILCLATAKKCKPEPSDAEVRTILVSAKADVGADSALIYAFQKNRRVCLPPERAAVVAEPVGSMERRR